MCTLAQVDLGLVPYLDVDSCDKQRRVQRKSAAAVHGEELLHLLQTLSED